MNNSKQQLSPDNHDPVRITIRVDDDETTPASCQSLGHFELVTATLPNGPEMLHTQAVDNTDVPGIRSARFAVGNGPAISIYGSGGGDIIDRKIRMLVNVRRSASILEQTERIIVA